MLPAQFARLLLAPAHVFVGRFDLQVPLSLIMVAAGAVVVASFGLIYILPPRKDRPDRPGAVVPRWVVIGLQTAAMLYVAFLLVVSLFGRQENPAFNAAALAFWVVTIPLLPLSHCIVGGWYEVANPFALLARFVTSGASARKQTNPLVGRLSYWPAVAFLLLLFWFELALVIVPQNPRLFGVLALVYIVFQVAMGAWLGEGWYPRGDAFQALTDLASTVAAMAIQRDGKGFVRFKTGFEPGRFLPTGPGREALITLWLAGVLADGVRVTPIWQAVTNTTASWSGSLGHLGSLALGDFILDSIEILFTWLAFGIFFWTFTYVAAGLSQRDPRKLAQVVSPSLIPIALAYLFAHNLTQLVILGPLVFTAGGTNPESLAALIKHNVQGVNPEVIFFIQVSAIVAGHVLAVIMAHARLSHVERDPARAIRADLGWLAAMVVYTATSLWVLAQPITNSG